MANKISVVIEKDGNGYYAYCPELKGCYSQGNTFEEALENIKEAAELYLETLSDEELKTVLNHEVLTTTIEVQCDKTAKNECP